MKKSLITSLLFVFTFLSSIAQWYGPDPVYTTYNVGIGTTVPALRTHIISSAASSFPATSGTAQTGGILRLNNSGTNGILDIGGNGGSGYWLQVTNQTGLDANYPLLLNPNGGYVGIGTTVPSSSLYVVGETRTGNSGQTSYTCLTGNQLYTYGGSLHLNYSVSDNITMVYGGGNVGIGTTAPNRVLQVGNITLGGSSDPDANIVSSGGVMISSGKMLSLDNSYYVHAYQKFQGAGDEKGFLHYGYYGHEFSTRTGSAIVIKGNSNNVGIGTTLPNSKFDLWNSTANTALFSISRPSNSAIMALYTSVDESDNTNITTQNGALNFRTNWNGGSPLSTLYLNYDGKVGIGTTTPQNLLDVFGTIHAKEFKASLEDWSDYVFNDGYTLPALKDVEKYIKANNRLPEIPSAKEVANNGVNLGEMNALLLKKVEELTLYVIELNKKIEKLESDHK